MVGALVSSLLSALGQVPAAWAYETDTHDEIANRSRDLNAYQNDIGTIFEIFFATTVPGEKRSVRANLNIRVSSTISDEILVSRHTIYCGPVGGAQATQIYGVQNVLRGQTVTLTPRFIFTAGEPGDYHCWVTVGSGRPRPSGTRTTSNVLRVHWDSYLEATTPVAASASQQYAPTEPSVVLRSGKAYDAAVLTWTAPPEVSLFAATGDAYLTTCSSVSGSTDPLSGPAVDPVTGKRLCEGLVSRSGTRVNTRLVVGQLDVAGTGYCSLRYYPGPTGRETFISKDLHHVVVFQRGASVPVSTAPACSRTFRIKVYVKHVSGAAVIAHKQGTITSIIPAGP